MNRDKIENSKHFNSSGQTINLDDPASPAILSGMLWKIPKNVSLIYQMKQSGKLPPETAASYRDNIIWYVDYLENRASRKANNVAEASLLQKIQLDRAKTESEWLNLRVKREELVDTEDLALEFEPYFTLMRGQLNALVRKIPEAATEIDNLLAHWRDLGKAMMAKSSEELKNFVDTEMNKQIDIGESDDE
jgi:hypothetical protein